MTNQQVKDIIKALDLKPHPEGGYYKRTYQSEINIDLKNRTRPISTAIYYLLESHDYSCWHRHKADEMWHHYCGSTILLYQLTKAGELTCTKVGDISRDPSVRPQCLIPANTWFAAEIAEPDSFTLIGCSVAPGFHFDDFEFADKTELLRHYPQHETLIHRLIKR